MWRDLSCSLEILQAHPERFAFTIRHDPEMGRGCFATREIAAGETLAFDIPLLVWEETEPVDSITARRIIEACRGKIHTNAVNLLTSYLDASAALRARVDDFAHLPDAEGASYIAGMTRVWRRLAEEIWENAPELRATLGSRESIVDLYTRSHLNAHAFGTGHAMLEIGSKFNHSCSPNATYNRFVEPSNGPTSQQQQESMRLVTIKPIRKGEQIFSTYIGGTDMLSSSRARRTLLMAAKAFYCRCERCSSPDILAPLPCPDCGSACLRHDETEFPWHCTGCPRHWWDADITRRESQLGRLILNLDADMTAGRFPPLQILRFVVRDALEDLGPHHYLAIQARLLLEELFAFREVTQVFSTASEEGPSRIANAWVYVEFLMRVVWTISPVVATNLSLLRLRTLLDMHHGRIPLGLPKHSFVKVLTRADTFLRFFWGEEDPDAALFRSALEREQVCTACQESLTRLFVCGSCASVHYCSRECQIKDKSRHEDECTEARAITSILNSNLAF